LENKKNEVEKVEYSVCHDIKGKERLIRDISVEQKKIKSELQGYGELLDCEIQEVYRKESSWKEKIEQLAHIEELIQQIIDENGARRYFVDYKEKMRQKKSLELRKENYEKNIPIYNICADTRFYGVSAGR
jgi:hypothetical protein